MKNKFHTLYRTSNGFIRYLKIQRNEIITKFNSFNNKKVVYEYQLEEYMELRELVLLDNEFFSLLDLGERIAVEDTAKDVELTEFGKTLLAKAQGKWSRIFFKGEPPYKELDPVTFGFVLEQIRRTRGYSKVKLASEIKFNRTYVARVEKGKMLPSLEYYYRFCRVFSISFDEIFKFL